MTRPVQNNRGKNAAVARLELPTCTIGGRHSDLSATTRS